MGPPLGKLKGGRKKKERERGGGRSSALFPCRPRDAPEEGEGKRKKEKRAEGRGSEREER